MLPLRAVILAGGLGTRISEETSVRPKPMVEIGGMPILWHIMKIYSAYGINDFVVCCGYKGYVIKEYFANYFLHQADVTLDLCENKMQIHNNHCERWRVTLVDTGEKTMTGGRLKRVRKYVGDETFCLTYGDGVSDVHIGQLIDFHKQQGRLATVTAVRPPGRFGALEMNGFMIKGFSEKPRGDGGWINGGFFVLEPDVFDLIESDNMPWENSPMEELAHKGQLVAYQHDGFWHPMDVMRDRNYLDELWASGKAPWKVWA